MHLCKGESRRRSSTWHSRAEHLAFRFWRDLYAQWRALHGMRVRTFLKSCSMCGRFPGMAPGESPQPKVSGISEFQATRKVSDESEEP